MLVETLVFSGQNSLFHDIRDLSDAYDCTPFFTEFAEQLSLRRDDPQRNLRLVIRQSGERRKRRPQQGQDESAEQRPDQAQTEHHRAYIEQPAL